MLARMLQIKKNDRQPVRPIASEADENDYIRGIPKRRGPVHGVGEIGVQTKDPGARRWSGGARVSANDLLSNARRRRPAGSEPGVKSQVPLSDSRLKLDMREIGPLRLKNLARVSCPKAVPPTPIGGTAGCHGQGEKCSAHDAAVGYFFFLASRPSLTLPSMSA